MNEIIHGDCLEVMPSIPDKSVDMILCDLPYGTTACKWDTIIPFEPLWEQYRRVIKDNGAIVLTASQPFTSALVMSNIKMFKYSYVWIKNLTSNFLNAKKQPLRKFEDVLIFYTSQPIYNPLLKEKKKESIRWNNIEKKGHNGSTYGKVKEKHLRYEFREIPLDMQYPDNVLNINQLHRTTNIHPTQKPVALFEYLIKTYTNENETVLDNCSGSGTTAIACINTNRNYICIEKDKTYFDLSVERVNNHKRQSDLFKPQ